MKHKREIIESKYPPKNNEDIWLKDLLLYASTTKGWLPLGSEKTYSNKTELLRDTPTGGTIGIDKETGTAYLYNDVSKEWTPVGGGGGGMTETTWQELKNKRDAGKLIPGSLYRITDYNCTTTQENTRSAGHQFDIVLLALSENKLAEEGWAMMHDNIYDVTFADSGTVSKCYIYFNGSHYNIVRVSDLIGGIVTTHITINEENKTAIIDANEEVIMTEENLQYSYFQNSNLSAWKVWYCLDNDKSRFAWADDTYKSKVSIIYSNVEYFYKGQNGPGQEWENANGESIFTSTKSPSSGDSVYKEFYLATAIGTVSEYKEVVDSYNGRGVIYRLIDEFNNDVCYDFKNIQFVRPMVDGYYDPEGEDTWVYTISDISSDNDLICDDSIRGYMKNTTIERTYEYEGCSILGNNVIIGSAPIGGNIRIFGNESTGNTIAHSAYITMYDDNNHLVMTEEGAMYIAGKKVLTEE